jgi:kynurenine 3-monooxygenase
MFWLSEAEKSGCDIKFDHQAKEFSLSSSELVFECSTGDSVEVDISSFAAVFGSDGAGSVLRGAMVKAGLTKSSEDILVTGYKEIVFPAGPGGSYLLDPHALHIWARKCHMLMALANTNGSFTGTLFMDRTSQSDTEPSFESTTRTVEQAEEFWTKYYADALTLTNKEETLANYVSSKDGILGTIRCAPWNTVCGERTAVCLIGDAAHAIVPFFGQGVNCGFEDVYVLKQLILSHGDLHKAIAEFGTSRKRDSDAIANLALENMEEMRSKVADSHFLFLKKLDGFIMSAFPKKYRTRYTLIMYSTNSYSSCEAIGVEMVRFLQQVVEKFNLTSSSEFETEIDNNVLEQMIDVHISPVAASLGVSFGF